jgi:nitrilase
MAKMVRAAVIQDHFVMNDSEAAVEHAAALVRTAAGKGAELAVFPEAFIGGYPKGSNFGAVVGMRSPEGREEFQRYAEGAIEVPGPGVEALSEAVGDVGIHAVIGVIEREGGTLYCATLLFAPDGRLMGKHRKLMPTAAERLIWGFGDGSTLPVVDTPLGKIGSVICWENYMPMLRM